MWGNPTYGATCKERAKSILQRAIKKTFQACREVISKLRIPELNHVVTSLLGHIHTFGLFFTAMATFYICF